MAAKYVRRYPKGTVLLVGSDEGLQQLISARFLIPALRPYAEKVKQRAQTTAPKGKATDREKTGRTKSYAESFTITTGVARGTYNPEHGGRPTTHKRAYARVQNNSRIAIYVEYGTSNITARRTLRKAAGITEFNAPGDKYGE